MKSEWIDNFIPGCSQLKLKFQYCHRALDSVTWLLDVKQQLNYISLYRLRCQVDSIFICDFFG